MININDKLCFITITLDERECMITEPIVIGMTEKYGDRVRGSHYYAYKDGRGLNKFNINGMSSFSIRAEGHCMNTYDDIVAFKKEAIRFANERYDMFIAQAQKVIDSSNVQKEKIKGNMVEVMIGNKKIMIDMVKAKELGLIIE